MMWLKCVSLALLLFIGSVSSQQKGPGHHYTPQCNSDSIVPPNELKSKDQELSITAKGAYEQDPFTLKCEFANFEDVMEYGTCTSMAISKWNPEEKKYKTIAVINAFQPENAEIVGGEDVDAWVNAKLGPDGEDAYLTLDWDLFDGDKLGWYKCEATRLDYRGHSKRLQVALQATPPSQVEVLSKELAQLAEKVKTQTQVTEETSDFLEGHNSRLAQHDAQLLILDDGYKSLRFEVDQKLDALKNELMELKDHKPKRVESGLGSCGRSKKWKSAQLKSKKKTNNALVSTVPIKFSQSFSSPPVFHVGITQVDAETKITSAVRLNVKVELISPDRAVVKCYTWLGSIVYDADFSWVAIGE